MKELKEITKLNLSNKRIEQAQWMVLTCIAKEISPSMYEKRKKFNISPYEFEGLVVVEIRRLKKQVENQRKVIVSLKKKAEVLSQLDWFLTRGESQ